MKFSCDCNSLAFFIVIWTGRNSKLGLSGRPSDVVGILATSKLYTLGDKTMAFLPQVRSVVASFVVGILPFIFIQRKFTEFFFFFFKKKTKKQTKTKLKKKKKKKNFANKTPLLRTLKLTQALLCKEKGVMCLSRCRSQITKKHNMSGRKVVFSSSFVLISEMNICLFRLGKQRKCSAPEWTLGMTKNRTTHNHALWSFSFRPWIRLTSTCR